jgi:hypothetical protein
MAKRIELEPGMRFGKLTYIAEGETLILPSGQSNRTALCLCDCGNAKQVRLLHLLRGRISSCGCLGGIHHGESKTKLYKLWRAINYRCHKSPYYNGYADKGVIVCEEWRKSYISFRNWALENGYKEELQIDRKENHLGYSPENCRFITNIENANNKTNTFYVKYRGISEPFMNIIHRQNLMLHEATIRGRIKRGWRVDDAFDIQIRGGNYTRTVYTENDANDRYNGRNKGTGHTRTNDKRLIKRPT